MEKREKITVSMTRQEQFQGLCYLFFQALLLPSLLQAILTILYPNYDDVALNLVFFAFNFGAAAVIFRRFIKLSLQELPGNLWPCIWKAALALLACKLAGQLLNALLSLLFPVYFETTALGPMLRNPNDMHIAQMASQRFWLMALGTVFLVPPVEELLHRGTVFGTLLPKSKPLAWLVSVILFSGIHILGYIGLGDGGLLLLCFLQYIFPAAALCWLYQSTGSLLAPILMHMAYNAIGILFVR